MRSCRIFSDLSDPGTVPLLEKHIPIDEFKCYALPLAICG